ncbi:MAG: hypothetical protein AAGJ40_08995 [Planctomycetota bacterium]
MNQALFNPDYVILKLDTVEMIGGAEIKSQFTDDRTAPWIAILDKDGTMLTNSTIGSVNIGCPVTKEECAHFVAMIESTIQHGTQDTIDSIATTMDQFASTFRDEG